MEYNKIKPNPQETKDNSEERPKLKKVVQATIQKKSLWKRFSLAMFGENGLPGVARSIGKDIIVPMIQNMIVDSIVNGVQRMVYKDEYRPYNYKGTGKYTNYNKVYTTNSYSSRMPQKKVYGEYENNNEEYRIPTRGEAVQVLDDLIEAAERYGNVSIADYYDMIGVPTNYTDNNYGWTAVTIRNAEIRPTRGGYVINFPRPEVL